MKKLLIGASTAAVLALTAACGGGGDTPSADGNRSSAPAATDGAEKAGHNKADVTFAQQMIPHHRQAVDMAEMALERSTNPKVKDLAERIKDAQDPEIQQLTTMLRKWGAPVESGGSDMPGMDHGSMSGSGMMTDGEMRRLGQASGRDFDVMWTQMMIKHHQGAVEMARTELQQGSNAEAKALAQRIIDAQEAEIREMAGIFPQ